MISPLLDGLSVGGGLCIGVLVGTFYAAEWKAGHTSGVRHDPRAKNLSYCLTGFLAIFATDLRALHESLHKGLVVGGYISGFFLSALLGVFIPAVGAARNLDPTARKAFTVPPWWYYIQQGSERFDKAVADANKRDMEALIAAARQDTQRSWEIFRAAVLMNGRNIHSLLRGDAGQITIEGALDRLRQALEISTGAAPGALSTNIMLRVARQKLQGTVKTQGAALDRVVRFAWPELVWDEALLLQWYDRLPPRARDPQPFGFALPLPCREHYGEQLHRVTLAGGPQAAIAGQPQIVKCNAPEFPLDCPERTQEEIRDFLQCAGFRSFASAPIIGPDGQPVGVVNVNAPDFDTFGETDDAQKRTTDILLLFCPSFALMVQKDNGGVQRKG